MFHKVEKWLEEIDAVTAEFQQEFGSVGVDVLNQSPGKGEWSVAQIIDHLVRVNESYFPVLEQVLAGIYKTPLLGRAGFVAKFWGEAALSGSGPARDERSERKMKTFKMWQPREREFSGNPLGEFASHQEALKKQMMAFDDMLSKGRDPVIASPASPVMVYHVSKAFDIIIAHERRHLQQARRALGSVAAP